MPVLPSHFFMVRVRTPVHARFSKAEIIIYSLQGVFAPGAVISPDLISMKIRGNLNIVTYVRSGFPPETIFSCLNKKLSDNT